MNLIISGTNRAQSNSLKVAEYYQKQLQEKGEKWEILALTSLAPELLSADLYGKGSACFASIQERVNQAEKFIFIIPEYNGSFPGVLKVFIDACIYPSSFAHKKAALIGISSGKYGNIRGVDHFTGICNYMRLHVLPLKLHIPSIQKEIDDEGNISDVKTAYFIQEQLAEIITF